MEERGISANNNKVTGTSIRADHHSRTSSRSAAVLLAGAAPVTPKEHRSRLSDERGPEGVITGRQKHAND